MSYTQQTAKKLLRSNLKSFGSFFFLYFLSKNWLVMKIFIDVSFLMTVLVKLNLMIVSSDFTNLFHI